MYVSVSQSSCQVVIPSIDELNVEEHVICPVDDCRKQFKSSSCLMMHQIRHHERKELSVAHSNQKHIKKMYYCPVNGCERNLKNNGKPFKRLGQVKQHYHSIHTDKIHVCEKCNRKFGLKDAYKRHVTECGTIFTCKSCDTELKSYNALYQHCKRLHHSLPEQEKSLKRNKTTLPSIIIAPIIIKQVVPLPNDQPSNEFLIEDGTNNGSSLYTTNNGLQTNEYNNGSLSNTSGPNNQLLSLNNGSNNGSLSSTSEPNNQLLSLNNGSNQYNNGSLSSTSGPNNQLLSLNNGSNNGSLSSTSEPNNQLLSLNNGSNQYNNGSLSSTSGPNNQLLSLNNGSNNGSLSSTSEPNNELLTLDMSKSDCFELGTQTDISGNEFLSSSFSTCCTTSNMLSLSQEVQTNLITQCEFGTQTFDSWPHPLIHSSDIAFDEFLGTGFIDFGTQTLESAFDDVTSLDFGVQTLSHTRDQESQT